MSFDDNVLNVPQLKLVRFAAILYDIAKYFHPQNNTSTLSNGIFGGTLTLICTWAHLHVDTVYSIS